MALEVLFNLQNQAVTSEELSHEMFREYLCRNGLCKYGTSPRACFPSPSFREILPELIEKWKAFDLAMWGSWNDQG